MKSKNTNPDSISPNEYLNDELKRRLESEVIAANSTIARMRSRATERIRKRNVDLRAFVVAANRFDSLIQSKINALMAANVLEVITRTEKLDIAGLPIGLFSGKKISFAVPHTSDCPANVEVTFDITHDSQIENFVVNYKLQIIPVFFQFDNYAQTVVPFVESNGKQAIQWIDDRMVDFTKAFFQIRFHDQYHKNHMATDPVLNIQFPKAIAFGRKEQDGKVVHFYTQESMLEFQDAPLNSLKSFTGFDSNAKHCT